MTELKGFEERKGAHRIKGAEHGVHPGRKTWLEEREHELATLDITEQPYVMIVGGGQGGIALGARLRRLDVPAIIVEKNAKPGDSWRKRYKSLCLHDPVWYDHLPYLPFPDDWPVFAPKDKIGDWLEMYSKVMELNFRGSTTAKTARFEEATQTWQAVVERDSKELTLRSKELVFALGVSGLPNVPNFPARTASKASNSTPASELVANGSIKLKRSVDVERLNLHSVVLSDGTELPADLIVYATGYGSMNGWLADLISPAVADKVGKVWGLGSDTPKDPGPWEGELRNMSKPTQVPHLWLHGGNLHQSRHYSEFLALQLEARREGLATPIYRLAPSHHKR